MADHTDQSVIDDAKPRCTKVIDGRFVAMTEAEQLPMWKQDRLAEIDRRTDELIEAGFQFDDGTGMHTYNLGLEAQSRLEGVYQLKDSPEFVWPLEWSTHDDLHVTSFADAATLEIFFGTAALTLRATIQSAYPVRAAVVGAVDKDTLDAIVDPR